MRKVRKTVVMLVASVMLLPHLFSCQSGIADELKLREDFLVVFGDEYKGTEAAWELEDIHVQRYFGRYRGCEVVYMSCPLCYTEALRPVEVAGYTIVFGSGQEVYVYKDSKFYTIEEAYNAKLITKANVRSIGKKINPGER